AIARTTLIDLLERSDRRQEAQQQRGEAIRALDEARVAVPTALRSGGTAPPAEGALPHPPPSRSSLPAAQPAPQPAPLPPQQVRFCSARDGAGLAYSVAGEGPPLVKTANWLNHLQ